MDTIVSKQGLIDNLISENTNIPNLQVQRAVEAIFDEMATALVCGDRVEIRGFGSLVVRKRPKGLTRNPKSGKKVEVADRGSLYFRASKELINNINCSPANENR